MATVSNGDNELAKTGGQWTDEIIIEVVVAADAAAAVGRRQEAAATNADKIITATRRRRSAQVSYITVGQLPMERSDKQTGKQQ